MFAQPNLIRSFTHYPPEPVNEENQFSIVPHTGSGIYDVAGAPAVPALSIQLPDRTWFDAPSDLEAFIVSRGDILRHWTNDRFLSILHRAINTSGRACCALPFFLDTHPDTLIECLPGRQSPDNPAK